MNIPVIGTVFTDIKGHPYDTFLPTGRNAGWIEYVHGGVGRNIAEDLARLGAKTEFVSLLSPGGTGDDVLARLQSAGVGTRFIKRSENGSGTWLAVYDETGEVAASISVRADLTALSEVLTEHHDEIFPSADCILLEIDIDTAAVEKVFEYAAQYGKKVCCAVATMSHALDKTDYLKKAELFICNLQEAGMLFDRDLSSLPAEELLRLLPELQALCGIRNLIITLSERGSVYISEAGETGFCPAQPSHPVDTTGAGDSYCAGAVMALSAGLPLSKACEYGAIVSAAVVSSAENVYCGEKIKMNGVNV